MAQICEEKAIVELIKAGKEVSGVKDPSKLALVATAPLSIMKSVYYCSESPTFTYWTGSHKVKFTVNP